LLCNTHLFSMEEQSIVPPKTFSLVECAELGWHDEVKKKLATTTHKKETLNTALIDATINGHTSVVKLLLDEGKADPNAKNAKEVRAITFAFLRRHYRIVDLLVAKGAEKSPDDDLEWDSAFIVYKRNRRPWDVKKKAKMESLRQMHEISQRHQPRYRLLKDDSTYPDHIRRRWKQANKRELQETSKELARKIALLKKNIKKVPVNAQDKKLAALNAELEEALALWQELRIITLSYSKK